MEATASQQAEVVALVRQAVVRDRQAFAALYDRYFDPIYKHVLYKVGRRAEAEDLTAEVFLRAWQAIDRYRIGQQPFGAWLYTIAHNAVVDHYRSRRAPPEMDVNTADEDIFIDPVAVAELRVTREQLRRAIRRLRPEHQQVIVLRFIDELGYPEVASIMGKSEGAVRVLQHRALRALSELLSREGMRA